MNWLAGRGTRIPILVKARFNARWSLDFVHDQLALGRRFRTLNIVDGVTPQCLAAILDLRALGKRVARELTADIERRGKPREIASPQRATLCKSLVVRTKRRVGFPTPTARASHSSMPNYDHSA